MQAHFQIIIQLIIESRMNLRLKLVYLSMMTTSIASLPQISKNHRCTINFRHQENSSNTSFTSCRPIELNGLTFDQITDWNVCQEICCHRKGQNLAVSFQQCLQPDAVYKYSLDALQVASYFLIFVVTLIFVVSTIYGSKALYNYLLRKYGRKSRKIYKQLAQDTITKSIYSIIWLSRFPNKHNKTPYQKNQDEQPNFSSQLRKSYCNLCKDINANLQSNCGHSFHTECLHAWLQRRPNCPKCPKKSIYYTKLYCLRCYSQYFILDADHYKKLGAICLECNTCVTKEQMRDKIVRYYWIDGKKAPSQQHANGIQVQ